MAENSASFYNRVYEVVRQVPEGKVTTYGAIAHYLGSKGSSRMVGWAMNNSHHLTNSVPAHRVVNRNGVLTGKHHFPGKNLMRELLENEGIEIVNDAIVDFSKVFWDPTLEYPTIAH